MITLTPERAATLKGFDTQVDLLLQVKAPKRVEGTPRSTLNLSVVLDRSGSMQGAPLQVAKQCAEFVQSRLTSDDLISLVAYDDEVTVLSPSSAASPNDHYREAVQKIDVGGTTNLFGGWEAGVLEVKKRAHLHEINRVLLLSDGCLNHGVTDPDQIKAGCLKASEEGVKTSTYGLGRHFDESVMCMMAEVSGGNNRYGERVEDLLEGFIEELDLLANLYANELTLILSPAEGVQVECLNSFVQRTGEFILPDLASGAEVWAGLRLKVSQGAAERAISSGESLLRVTIKAKCRDGELNTEGALGELPPLSPTVFESIAPQEAVTKYIAELKISELKIEAAQAARRKDWKLAKELIEKMRALPMTDAQRAELKELEQLFDRREAELFSKEAHFSGSQSQRVMKSDVNSFLLSQNWVGSASYDQAASPSYLRRKSRVGRSSDSQVAGASPPPDAGVGLIAQNAPPPPAQNQGSFNPFRKRRPK
jgi:Ca-activated chloride channel family protein